MALLDRQNLRATILKESIIHGGNGGIEECFLKGHFRHSLCARFRGGDACEDFQGNSMREIDAMGRLAPKDHPFWASVGGRALRAFYDRHWDWTPVTSDDDIDEEYREMLWNRLQQREQGRMYYVIEIFGSNLVHALVPN
ncbi:hypothetical protein CPC08DRAFT_731071 [Agrocybe pediades]|nr:hypothetical protein CPC08DRAFT_731071 [Agrocybe pediades]